MAPPRVAVIFYSIHGHVLKLARAEIEGIRQAGGHANLFQIAETLPPNALLKMGAIRDQWSDVPFIEPHEMVNYDALLFGVPTRYGNMPGQWKAFWDKTGKLWKDGSLAGKYVGVFFSTSTLGGGQEMTASNMMSTFVHHGMIYVPLGYSQSFGLLGNLNEVHGGSAWGAGTLSAADGSREVSRIELEEATLQGKQFYEILSRVKF
ncbi:flavoprotein-like protein [Amanita rubescens]|nr:flavoprotein-like protein [Amanita rubescens]